VVHYQQQQPMQIVSVEVVQVASSSLASQLAVSSYSSSSLAHLPTTKHLTRSTKEAVMILPLHRLTTVTL
jgi:hypothetical protein